MDGRQQKLLDEYREKVLGKTCLKSAPAEYWEIGLINDLKIGLPEWEGYSLDQKARLMARSYLANMISTIDRHYEEQDAAQERLAKKNKGK